MSKNIIELNGKRYDAVTGALLGKARPHAAKLGAPKVNGRVVDGFIRPTAASAPTALPAKPKKATLVTTPAKVAYKKTADITAAAKIKKPAKAAINAAPTKATHQTHKEPTKHTTATAQPAHSPAKPLAAHAPQHARTLMRRAVHKPEFARKPAIKPQAPAEIAAVPSSKLAPKRSVASVDPGRLARAARTLKHAAVVRFPRQTRAAGANSFQELYHVPTKVVPVIPVRAAPAATHLPQQHNRTDMFEAAMARATSHTQPVHRIARSRKRRLANISAVVATFLVIGGFVALLNVPNIQLHVASIQAGFKAAIPNYTPVGYALAGGVRRTGDTVSMVYRSGENNYTVTQQPTDWTSQTLVENTLPLQHDYQTVQAGEHTVFIYDHTNAVWIAGNVRYDVIGNAPLTATDMQQLAMSL
ncbi:MAG TPA: hypothetical protein VJP80_02825 [Candidatus Saccharimonadales bacterium]|nr:hypothetical protein [Candidatus Saccharimonadales bacterium]